MSQYTTQLRFICESYAGLNESTEQKSVDDVIESARTKIFDFSYPIFNDDYKPNLESKIISHFYTQEIGSETVGLFKLRLKNKMREIMPFYNQLYLSEWDKIGINPFVNTDYETTIKNVNNSTSDTDTIRAGVSDIKQENSLENTITGNKSIEAVDTTAGSEATQASAKTADKKAVEASESETDTLGTKTTTTPMSDRATLVKHSDTPLGSINGTASVGDDNNMLSDVTMTVDNYNGGSKSDVTANSGTNKKESDKIEKDVTRTNGASQSKTESDSKTVSNTTESDTTQTINTANNKTASTNKEDVKTANKSLSENNGVNRVYGKTGSESYSSLLLQYRETFVNIDMMVIEELEPLFMGIW